MTEVEHLQIRLQEFFRNVLIEPFAGCKWPSSGGGQPTWLLFPSTPPLAGGAAIWAVNRMAQSAAGRRKVISSVKKGVYTLAGFSKAAQDDEMRRTYKMRQQTDANIQYDEILAPSKARTDRKDERSNVGFDLALIIQLRYSSSRASTYPGSSLVIVNGIRDLTNRFAAALRDKFAICLKHRTAGSSSTHLEGSSIGPVTQGSILTFCL